MTALAEALDGISVAELRRRGGLKWTFAGPDVLGAFVAEMDFGTAPEVDDGAARGDRAAGLRVSHPPRGAADGRGLSRRGWPAGTAGPWTRTGSAPCPT